MRGFFPRTGANRAAEQRILGRSVAAFRNPCQGFLAAAKPEGQRDLIHIAGVSAGQRQLPEDRVDESLCENNLLARMSGQMRSVILPGETGEGRVPRIEMADDMGEKFVSRTGGGRLIQSREARQKSMRDGASDALGNAWSMPKEARKPRSYHMTLHFCDVQVTQVIGFNASFPSLY